METRGAGRRRWEAAHKALWQPAPALEAALAAAGPPGSPAVLAVLAQGDHALLREAIALQQITALAPLIRSYGGAPDAPPDARLLQLLEADLRARPHSSFVYACSEGDAAAVAALLGVGRRAGGAIAEALAQRGRRALKWAACAPGGPDAARLLLAEIGPPGSAPVLEVLAANNHRLLRYSCCSRGMRATAAVVEAYGPPGGPAVLGALADENHTALNTAVQCGNPEALAAVLRGYGPAGGAAVRAALERGCRGYGHPTYRDEGNAHVLHYCFNEAFSFSWRPHDANAKLPLLLAALGEGPDHPTALRALDEVLEAFKRFEKINWLITVPKDSPLARLALLSPAAWAMGGAETARTLLSAPVLAALQPGITAALSALEGALPAGVAEPVGAYFRARPWLSFSFASDVPATLPPEDRDRGTDESG